MNFRKTYVLLFATKISHEVSMLINAVRIVWLCRREASVPTSVGRHNVERRRANGDIRVRGFTGGFEGRVAEGQQACEAQWKNHYRGRQEGSSADYQRRQRRG